MLYHLSVNIDEALEKLNENNIFYPASPKNVSIILNKAKKEGKIFYSGCDNMDKDGRCAGHKDDYNQFSVMPKKEQESLVKEHKLCLRCGITKNEVKKYKFKCYSWGTYYKTHKYK